MRRLGFALIATLLAALFALAAAVQPALADDAEPGPPRPPNIEAKGTVDAAVFVERVEQIDMENGSFDAFFSVGMLCPWDCEWKDFQVVNGTVNRVTSVYTGDERKLWEVEARMYFTPDLREYPFDQQQLPIEIEHADADARLVTFKPVQSLSGLEDGINVSGWNVTGWELKTNLHSYLNRDSFSQLRFAISLDRNVVSSSFSVLLPALTMTLVALASLLLRDPRDQFRASGTALLGMLLFWVGVSASIEQTDYLTLLDKFMGVIYATIALVLFLAVMGELLIQRFEGGRTVDGETSLQRQRLHTWSIRIIPAAFVVGMLAVWVAN